MRIFGKIGIHESPAKSNEKMTPNYCIQSLLVFLLFLGSCKKKPAIEIDAHFEGNWKHYTGANSYEHFYFQHNSRGEIERYENGMSSGTLKSKWLIKNDIIYLGWFGGKNYKYEISKYPTIADTTFFHNFDSIPIGKMYMILNGNYYIK